MTMTEPIHLDPIPDLPEGLSMSELHDKYMAQLFAVLAVPAEIIQAEPQSSTRAALDQFYVRKYVPIYVVAGTHQQYEDFLRRRNIRKATRIVDVSHVRGIGHQKVALFYVGTWTETMSVELADEIGKLAWEGNLVLITDHEYDNWRLE